MQIPPALSALAAAAGVAPATAAGDWKAAQGFAAMAAGELLRPMFATVDLSRSRFGGGAGEAAWTPILVQAIGHEIAGRGGFGIADSVFRELLREQHSADAGAAASTFPGVGGKS